MPNAIFFYRISRWLYRHHIPILPKITQAIIFLLYNSKIPCEANIGDGSFFVVKGIGVCIHPNAVIGRNCRIGIGSKIVGKGPYKKVALLGDNVFIGPGAVLVGPIIIEDNVVIAPNAVVVNSVPKGAIVGGIPAKIIGWVDNLNYNILDNCADVDGHADYLIDNR